MKITIKTFVYMFIAVVMISSCKKDPLFSGKDNAIASFQLSKNEVVLKAAISPGKIIITAPDNMVLKDAKPVFILSEHASIKPDPASITDWDAAHEFIVTSKNGTQNNYAYSVERNVISKDGDVVLISQEDVDAFSKLELEQVNGSLTIGAASGANKITSIDGLSGIKSIKYDLIINPNYTGKDLSAFKNLETIGSLQVGAVPTLESITLPKLKKIMLSLVIDAAGVKSINFPELTNIDWALQILNTDLIEEISFPKLQRVFQNLKIEGSYTDNQAKELDFPLLEDIGGDLSITRMAKVTKVGFAKLLNVGTFSITSLNELTSLSAPKLKNVKSNLGISYNYKLNNLDLSSLQTLGGNFRMENLSVLTNVDGLKSLTAVGGEFYIYSMSALRDLKGFKALQSVGTNVMLSGFEQLQDQNMDGLSSLKSIGGTLTISQVPFKKFSGFALTQIKSLSIFGYVSTIEEIDVSNINSLESLTISNINNSVKVKGKEVFNGLLSLETASVDLDGFKEVKDFSYNMGSNAKPNQSISIRKITNKFTMSVYGFSKFSMPELEEIVGPTEITVSSAVELSIPALKKTGNFIFTGAKIDLLSLPSLQTVDGNLDITTGNYNGSLGDIKVPALTKINGRLKLAGYSDNWRNERMTNLDGFSALTSVKSIEISYNKLLVDYKGLKKAILSISSLNWSTTGNKYNPTFADVISGKYVE